MAPLAMMPTEENGERLPALAPLATINAVRNGETPTRWPTAMASGTRSATVEIAPGPTEQSAHATRKRQTGITRALPRASLMARWASPSSVPLVSAIAKSRVTPDNVRKSVTGKPAMTASGRMPA